MSKQAAVCASLCVFGEQVMTAHLCRTSDSHKLCRGSRELQSQQHMLRLEQQVLQQQSAAMAGQGTVQHAFAGHFRPLPEMQGCGLVPLPQGLPWKPHIMGTALQCMCC